MQDSRDVILKSGRAAVKSLTDAVYHWPDLPYSEGELVFARACEIERTDWEEGIRDCVYEVHGRKFRDLSCMEGETLRKLSGHWDLRRHADGTEFLHYYASLPTFDSGDRVWGSDRCAAVYADTRGVNLIDCTYGYRIPRIKVYVGLTKAAPALAGQLELVKKALLPPQEEEERASLLSRIAGFMSGKTGAERNAEKARKGSLTGGAPKNNQKV